MNRSGFHRRACCSGWAYGLLSLALCYCASVAALPPGSYVGYYISQYGQINPQQNVHVAEAYAIFERVSAVADKSKKRLPQLVVLNSHAEPWAISLPDGHIVLSIQAINICRSKIKPSDACLAFILGHELAHLANDDFWHQEVYSFLSEHKATQSIAHFLKKNSSSMQAELAADDKGFIYAAMAGFPVADLIDTQHASDDFFALWMQLTHSQVIDMGGEKNRSAPLLQRLKELKQKLAFYEFGVRLSHFGFYDDSIYFLKEFQKVFPGREVFNNLGFCYLQMAIQQMDANRAWFYWLPTVLDSETQAVISSRGAQAMSSLKMAAQKQQTDLLDKAIDYLKQAIQADTYYIPAKINLSVALLYAGEPLQARVTIQQLRALKPSQTAFAELEALAIYEESDEELDHWPVAVDKLTKLIKPSNGKESSTLRYNLARLLQIRAKTEDSMALWNQLATQDRLPPPIKTEVCSRQKSLPIQECMHVNERSSQISLPWQWPLSTNALQTVTTTQLKQLASWDKMAFDWYQGDLYGQIYNNPVDQSQVLILGKFVQMQVIKHVAIKSVNQIQSMCAKPLSRRELAAGTVFTCAQWAVLVRNNEIFEAWWMAM